MADKELNPSPKFPQGTYPQLSPNPKFDNGLVNKTGEKPNGSEQTYPREELRRNYTKPEIEGMIHEVTDHKADLVGGKVPATQLPSYVDDVVEGYLYNGAFYEDAEHTTEIEAEEGKIYVDLSTNETYRWSGTQYVKIGGNISEGVSYTTTAPTEANPYGLKVVVLTSEPATKYDGWLYIITEA